MALTPGARLGPYEIAAYLDRGGMGEVYKARDTRLDRTVAIKVLPPHVAADPERKQRFEREAKAISSLNHPHICTLHDVGSQDGIDFLVLEHIEGETLAQRLSKGAVPLDQALQYAIQIADALAKAHRQGIVHRDLKPGNIMLTKSGAKLLDFGLAKLRPAATVGGVAASAAPTVSSPITGSGSIVGTFQYMAPEQVEGHEADARTDIHAFGAVLYEMLTGKRAFEGKSQASLIAAILDHQPTPPSAIQRLTPPAVDHVVATCLAKDPDERWQSASDLVRELAWIAESPAATGAADARVVRHSKRRQALLLVAASGIVGISVGLVTWRMTRPAAQPLSRLSVTVPAGVQPCCPVIAPNGRMIAFGALRSGQRAVHIRRMDDLATVPVRGAEGTFPLDLSPDGQWLLVDGDGRVRRAPIAGGPATPIAELGPGGGASVGPDGTVVLNPGPGQGLFVVSVPGGAPTTLTSLEEGELGHAMPNFLPGGRAVLFTAATGSPSTAKVAVYDFDEGKRRTLLLGVSPRYAASGHLLFWRDGALWAVPFDPDRLAVKGSPVPVVQGVHFTGGPPVAHYSVATDGTLVYIPEGSVGQQQMLVWVDRNGGEEPLSMKPRAYRAPRLSPDGRRVAIDTVDGDLFLYDLGARVEQQFTFDSSIDRYPLWSPDGTQIYFSSTQDGEPAQLYVKPADGGRGAERVLAEHVLSVPGGWSADGKTLVFSGDTGSRGSSTRNDIFTVRLGEDGRHEVLMQAPHNEVWPTVSPNGRWLAYGSDETGQRRIYVRPFPEGTAGDRRVISEGFGDRPLWGRDGRELFYHSDESVVVVPVETGQTFRAGAPRRLFSIEPYTNMGGFYNWDIAPDGQRFLMVKREAVANSDAPPPQIVVVQHWFEELKRLVPTN